MKRNKLKIFTKILAIIIVCLISFLGIYVQKLNKMENIVKGYTLGNDLKGYRETVFEIDAETSDDLKKVENYEKSKDLVEKRLNKYGVEDYNLSLDKKTGKMYLQITENDLTDTMVSNVKETGKFEIKDSEDGTVLLDNSKIETVRAMYNTSENGTIVYLEIKLNKEGTEILSDMSTNKYATLKEENKEENKTSEDNTTAENNTTEGNTTAEENTTSEKKSSDEKNTTSEEKKQAKITLVLSGTEIDSTSFEKPVTDGRIDLTLSNATTDSDEIRETLNSAAIIANVIENGPLPIKYNISLNQYTLSEISNESIMKVVIAMSIILAILLVYMIVKYKAKGVYATISFVGFIALFLLLLRYTNVIISISSIVAIAVIALINYVFNMKLLEIDLSDKKKLNEKYLQFLMKIIPALGISIIFTFVKWSPLSTFGMTILWGLALIFAYNRIVTKSIVD